MSEIEKFSELVQDAQRGDGYINATKWCKAFGSRLDKWKQLPETKAKADDLSHTLKNSVSNSEIFHTPQAGVSNFESVKITGSEISLALELKIDIGVRDAISIVKDLAIANTYPLMNEADQQKFKSKYFWSARRFNFVPTEDCPTPPLID
ncbi:KilA-N domain-containing protein [Cylindrospermum stagnale PCC 7417]|uniref:KilA-N domain-containing protein n=1 Tax=Cylindrospermum stagnale PCC 7417 TaxID=56107 RepID=K9X707_9NOST|nr:KilA-N domain-containing protein [Cylindrospermum stagnale]AFZ27432.1 KilA-N domain-containing protein [Cylindrospermum stagnale PCC 7417]